ncbi:MAG TPA: carboxypeptidase regulatory-like domain-containing protein [Terriglobales bacterium]|nr:carboxypeptidase regulatory-like domain-containing protein [Terriglobales bacterium]
MKLSLSLFFVLSASLMGQTSTLRGVVTDETGAVIPSANVAVNGPGGTRSATTGKDGSYVITGLRLGDYSVQASAPNLGMLQPAKIALGSGFGTLNLQLRIAVTTQQITVADSDAPAVSTDAAGNASAVIIKGAALDALSDDPADLQADLQALAGPSAGPNGGQIFVDGFSGGELPPKESIREVRINQNPFSPEYDKIGLGRIEILTKPGTDKLRGSVSYNYMGDFWNSRNPYAAQKAPLQLNEFRSNLSGSLNRRASFTLDVSRESIDNGSIVNAIILDPVSLVATPFTAVPAALQRRTQVRPRADYQLNANNTLTVSYQYSRSDIQDAGIGSFDLLSRAYHTPSTNQTLQATETAVFGTTINETRFQYSRNASETIPNLQSPTIQVLGSFNGGGAQTGHAFNTQNNYELQNYTTMIHGGHVMKFGVRTRTQSIDSTSPQNYNGTFTFGGGQAPMLDANNQLVLDPSGQPVFIGIQSIERYRRTLLFQQLGYTPTQIRALGGGATQFSINSGIPEISGNQTDVSLFFGDDWKLRPNFTMSLGLRYETQTNIHDWGDWAPRIGLAWAPGGSAKQQPKTVFRAGFGMFYDRFGLNNTLTARRFNGIIQQQYVVTNPDFFSTIPTISTLGAFQTTQVTREVESDLRAPYTYQAAFTVERQLPRGSTLAVTYTGSRGLHVPRSLDINAPLPGTYDPSIRGSGVFPLGNSNPLFLMTSSGLYNQNQVSVNVNARVNRDVSLTGTYTWNHARSNTDGLGTYPANPYNYSGEYGPASSDVHHTVSLNGSIDTKWGIRFSPLLNIQSGSPFDITTGSDLYGTTLFNARPGIATDPSRPGLIPTKYGLLDPNPAPGETILSRNYGRGPGQISVNMRLAKTFGFGPERGGGGRSGGGSGGGGQGGGGFGGGPTTSRRYNMSISLSVRNLLNHTNPGPIIGNVTSPLFGQANQMAGGGGGGFSENANNRRLEMQVRFTF